MFTKVKVFFFSSPSRMVLMSFAVAILLGALLLLLPKATPGPGQLSLCDALFT